LPGSVNYFDLEDLISVVLLDQPMTTLQDLKDWVSLMKFNGGLTFFQYCGFWQIGRRSRLVF
jgi:hypothetical protein